MLAFSSCTVHRFGVGEAIVVEMVDLISLLLFLPNISFSLTCTAQTLVCHTNAYSQLFWDV